MSEIPLPLSAELSDLDEPARKPASHWQDTTYQFGEFRVATGSRTLVRDGEVVELGGRAFDLLVVLLHARGTVVSKTDITRAVWPSMIVDDSNLRFQMACLRKVLGPYREAIKTVQGRGYLFVADTVSVSNAPVVHPGTTSQRSGPALVAVVDDDDNTREALDGLLRSWGYLVETYSEANSLLRSRRAEEIDCLVLDVWLPNQSGLEFQSFLKGSGYDIPIVFISGHADVHMSVRAMKAGAVEFLTKPVRHQDLLEAIKGAVSAERVRA